VKKISKLFVDKSEMILCVETAVLKNINLHKKLCINTYWFLFNTTTSDWSVLK